MIDRRWLPALSLATALGACGAPDEATPHRERIARSAPPAECRRAQPANDAPNVAEYSAVPPATAQNKRERPALIDRFAGRDGASEALSDARCGHRLKIYTHVSNGAAPDIVSPGIAFCSPPWSTQPAGRHIFRVMEAAAFHEGVRRTEAQQALATSAISFAQAYNSTIFRLRAADVKAICPCAAPASASATRPAPC